LFFPPRGMCSVMSVLRLIPELAVNFSDNFGGYIKGTAEIQGMTIVADLLKGLLLFHLRRLSYCPRPVSDCWILDQRLEASLE